MENNLTEYNFLGTATYSPEDNKLRLYPFARLDAETYQRVKKAGFIWAGKQELFVAPMWTPSREDILIELCGEIGDEDTSLVERAEERAERFDGYSEKRADDAHRAKEYVKSITDGIPFGQPILVGHHSERRARKDAEKIENGMRKAVKMWETSKYWEDRAKGAISHAKYKERPDVRARRIKGLEADIRRLTAEYTPNPKIPPIMQHTWDDADRNAPQVEHRYCGKGRGGRWVPTSRLKAIEGYNSRWINHLENRLIYEKTMLNEQGASSLIEKKPRPKQLPLCNYRAPEGVKVPSRFYGNKGQFDTYQYKEMTKAEYMAIYEGKRGTREVENSHRVRIYIDYHHQGGGQYVVFLTDQKVTERPESIPDKPKEMPVDNRPAYIPPEKTEFDDMKDTLKAGIKTVSAPQLFVTPPEIAAKMVEYADIEPGMCVLEPSAGTGSLIDPIVKNIDTEILAYELNQNLCSILSKKFPSYRVCVKHANFLEVTDFQGEYPRIVMNPPFENGIDIKHIEHARKFLKPGGRLVALCANGPRQRAAFMDIAEHWEDLPAGSFKESGTNVNVALMVLTA
jgi:phospholipid N-methyltransferase